MGSRAPLWVCHCGKGLCPLPSQGPRVMALRHYRRSSGLPMALRVWPSWCPLSLDSGQPSWLWVPDAYRTPHCSACSEWTGVSPSGFLILSGFQEPPDECLSSHVCPQVDFVLLALLAFCLQQFPPCLCLDLTSRFTAFFLSGQRV